MTVPNISVPLILRDAKLREALLVESAEGQHIADVAEACGVPKSTLEEWLTKGRALLKAQADGNAPDNPDDITLAEWAGRFGGARARSRNGAIRAIHSEITAPSEDSRDIVYAAQVYLSLTRPALYSKAAQAKAALTGADTDGDLFADEAGLSPAVADALIKAAKMARAVDREYANGHGKH